MADFSDEFNLEASIERMAGTKEPCEYTERMTALIECCQTGTVQDVDAFIKKYPQPSIHDLDFQMLFFIVEEKNWDVIKHLIEKHNFDPRTRNETLLYQAAKSGHLGMVEYLVKEHSADIHASNDCAFRHACLREHYDVAKFLLEQGADTSKISPERSWATARITCDAVVQNMAKKAKAQKIVIQQAKQNEVQQANVSKVKNKIGHSPVRRRPKRNTK